MEAFGILIIWILSVAFVALGNRSGSHSEVWENAKNDAAKSKAKNLELMLNRVVADNQHICHSDYDRQRHCYYVHIAWEKNGEKFGEYLYAYTIEEMERKIKNL